jgi:hypothetical protein
MGVIYSYYDQKRHVVFDMGKWYCWDDEPGKTAVARLFLPRDFLVAEIEMYMQESGWEDDDHAYAVWLADLLIQFRADAKPEDIRWINDFDSDDSDDVTYTCKLCGKYAKCYSSPKCVCFVSQPCRTVGSRFQDDYVNGSYVEPDQ